MSKRRRFARSLAAMVLAVVAPGCAMLGLAAPDPGRASASMVPPAADEAVDRAEAAARRRPADAAVRARLGHAYLRAGRFAAAAGAFDDALALGNQDGATALGLALAEAALGHGPAAVQLLDDWRAFLNPADRGLALALAGETSRGVEVLGAALRGAGADGRVRQNLALAYALDGRWREARLMAEQDLPPREAEARIGAWAMMGRPDAVQQRVAHLLGAPLRTDPGYPQGLALAPPPAPEPDTGGGLVASAATPVALPGDSR